jgi:putative colanic acid biosynthesis acetyltransferase WcaF
VQNHPLPRLTDVVANRRARKWQNKELIGRVFWRLATLFFAISPRPFWSFRRVLLRMFGAKIGKDVNIYPSVRVSIPWNLHIEDQVTIGAHAILYALGPIHIAERSLISHYAYLCAGSHDYRYSDLPLTKPPIFIGAGAWVCTDAFIGPGVIVGARSIVGARAVVVKDVPPDTIVGGNPARILKPRCGFID